MPRKKRKNKKHRLSERRRAIYVLPNLITTFSLLAGFVGLIMALEGHFERAALAVIVSLVLDGLDGKVARATGSTSRFGVEYDSLADVIAFGVTPAVLAFQWAHLAFGRLGWFLCSWPAVRLAGPLKSR